MNKKTYVAFLILLSIIKVINSQEKQPNILWILTDDQRYDSVKTFNKALTGNEMSKLGYIESPQVDKLADMGTTFINTYCQATGCAPSRASMHYGRYPFRSGVYEFEYHNNKAEHCKPSLPEQMANIGYQTMHVGKLGFRIKTLDANGKTIPYSVYETDIDFKKLGTDGFTDWGKAWFHSLDGEKFDKPIKNLEYFVTPQGEFEYASSELEKLRPQYKGSSKKTIEKYDLLRHYNPNTKMSNNKGMIISGVSSQPAGKTRDGYYTFFFKEYLNNTNKDFKAGSRTFKGVDPSKPLFAHIGFDFPHTPVLPPADFRERFQKHIYKIPIVTKKELNAMPEQLKRQVKSKYTNHLSDEDKQKMIQDYYAFCAYGDQLVGEATEAFINYSETNNRPWMIVYVCGDHGWKLNEHGAISKFTPWELDSHNPIIIVSSDKKKFPAGKIATDFTEFVDIAPTVISAAGANLESETFNYLDGFDLAKVASEEIPTRDYIIGESHAVTGPRAYIRTKEYVFSIKIRPHKKRGQDLDWALSASYEDLDPALYHTTLDPDEINNLAFEKPYEKIAKRMKDKLISIVLGDNRVEVNWGKKANGTTIYRSNFSPGAHNYKLTF